MSIPYHAGQRQMRANRAFRSSRARAQATLRLDIHLAKITIWAGRAEDAFTSTRRNTASSATDEDNIDDSSASAEDTIADNGRAMHATMFDDDEIKTMLDALRKQLQKPCVDGRGNTNHER